jgi:FHS family glucose/mannose:H+ symporter-like MFS transporter
MFNKKIVFPAACLGMLLFGIGLITLGSIAPDLKVKFNLNDLSAGTLFSILPIGILVGSLLFGPVCDRFGYKVILIISCIGMFAGFEGIANVSSLDLLRISIFLFGVGAGIMNGAANAVISDISKGSEGANLSLLGVFFGIGALGMPFILGLLKNSFTSFQIITWVGWFTLATGLLYSLIKFPLSKKALGFTGTKTTSLFKDRYLYLIAFFLFFDGSLEAIFNNWTTLYLAKHNPAKESSALYALSSYVAGMTLTRLLIGSLFRKVAPQKLFLFSLPAILVGILLIQFGHSYFFSVAGLILNGAGLAAGFPIMLGLAGNRYAARSATAFSIILTIALLGNMLVNYLMGVVAHKYGIQHYTSFAFAELACMTVLCLLIFLPKKNKASTIKI